MEVKQQKLANELLFNLFSHLNGKIDDKKFALLQALYLPHALIIKNVEGDFDTFMLSTRVQSVALHHHSHRVYVMTSTGWKKVKDRSGKNDVSQ